MHQIFSQFKQNVVAFNSWISNSNQAMPSLNLAFVTWSRSHTLFFFFFFTTIGTSSFRQHSDKPNHILAYMSGSEEMANYVQFIVKLCHTGLRVPHISALIWFIVHKATDYLDNNCILTANRKKIIVKKMDWGCTFIT